MNKYHEIVDGKCKHCEVFRFRYTVVDGICSMSIRPKQKKPSKKVIQRAELIQNALDSQAKAAGRKPGSSMVGWNK